MSVQRLLAVCAVLVAAVAPQPARADDRAAIDEGRSAGRGVLMLREPSACGIAVLRERCIADAEAFLRGRGDGDFAFVPKIGPHPATGLRAFVTSGDLDALDAAMSWINNTEAQETRWKADARSAALYDAGVLTVFLPAAKGDRYGEMVASEPAIDLARHVASIPPGALPVDTAPLRAMSGEAANANPSLRRMPRLVPFAKTLVAAVAAAAPPTPIAVVPRTATPASDAALGVAFSTMGELIDAPAWEAQDDAQAFAKTLADRLDALVPEAGRGDVVAFRANARAGVMFEHDRALASLNTAGSTFMKYATHERVQRFSLAAIAAQLAYNAAILRSPEHSAMMLRMLAISAPLDAPIPGWSAARGGAASIGASDWLAQRAYALRLVDLIQKANAA